MDDNTEVSGEAGGSSSGGNSGGSSGGGSSSSGGSSGGGSSGARGVDSSHYTPGENRGARYLRDFPIRRYEEETSGKRGQSYRSNYKNNQGEQQGGATTHNVFVVPSEENTMKECTYVPFPLGGMGGFGYGAAAPVAAPYGGPALIPLQDRTCDILLGQSNIRGEVKDAECSVKDSIMMSNSQRQTAELNLHNRLCDAEKAALESKWASVTATKDAQNALSMQAAECCCDLKDGQKDITINVNEKFCNLEHNIDNKFFHLERFIDKGFDAIRERECASEIVSLKAEVAALRSASADGTLAATIISALKK